MAGCTDPRFGDRLHAYEIDVLSDTDSEQFETHLLECNDCYQRVRAAAAISDLMNQDNEVLSVMEGLAAANDVDGVQEAEQDSAARGARRINLNRYLLAAALIICIALPGYYFLYGPASGPDTVQELLLLSMRGGDPKTLSLETGGQAEIRFMLVGARPDQSYSVTIASPDGDTVYVNPAFSEFDDQEVGIIRMPVSRFELGFYNLTIRDPAAPEVGILRQYIFKVE